MALYSRVKTWVSNEILTASDLNAEFDNIINNSDVSSIAGYSANVAEMQTVADPGGVGSESLASTMAEEITRLRFMFKFLTGAAQWYVQTGRNLSAGSLAVLEADIGNNAVTQNKIADGSVTTVKIADTNITTAKIADANVTTAKIADANVTTTKIADSQITPAKMATPTYGTSSKCASYTYSGGGSAFQDVTNLSVTITCTSLRPVLLKLYGDPASANARIAYNDTSTNRAEIAFLRGSTTISRAHLTSSSDGTGRDSLLDPSNFSMIDLTPGSGSVTFKVQVVAAGTSTVSVYDTYLVAMEL